MIQITIVNVDFYLNSPEPNLDVVYSEFRGSTIRYVPVIRIFGNLKGNYLHFKL